MKHTEVITKWLGGKFRENIILGYQCVAWAKKYVYDRYNISLGVFGGSALSGWENKSNTFPSSNWVKVEYKPGLIPPAGAIIFWWATANNKYGHVAIVDEWSTKDNIVIVEQNGQLGWWKGTNGDEIRRITIKPNARGALLGWYIHKSDYVEPVKDEKPVEHNYVEIFKNESIGYEPIFIEHKGERLLPESQVKALIDIALSRFEKRHFKK